CDFQLCANELLRPLKGERDKRSDVVSSDGLIGLVSADRIQELAFQDSNFDLIDVVVLHERCGAHHGSRKPQLPNVLLDLPLALPMVDTGVTLGSTDRTVYKVRYARLFCGISEILALFHFTFGTNSPEILHAVDTVNATNRSIEGTGIFQV